MRRGGLVAYVEDLMEEQVRRGHEVAYLFSGRHYPFLRRPRVRRWRRGPVTMVELLNSPLYDHGRQPDLELGETRIEQLAEQEIQEFRPDVIHVQELAGLPSSLLDVGRRAGRPVVMTLQDYFPLCSTFKLLDSTGQVCLRREVGEDCVATVAASPRNPALLFEATLWYHLDSTPVLRSLSPERKQRLTERLLPWYARSALRNGNGTATAAAFQRRRDVNVERLSRADRLIAMSSRVAEIYAQLGVDSSRLETTHLTLAHIERLRPRVYRQGEPITFATLGGGESVAKGSRVLLDAFRSLSSEMSPGRIRLVIFGFASPEVVEEVGWLRDVEIARSYRPDQLDRLLDEVDVGIMPSVWEEAYGYAGIEFLAKGIPVIANELGGMVDYVRDGETGWLNRSRDADGLAAIVRQIADHPDEIAVLNERLRRERNSIVISLSRHAADIDEIYRDVVADFAP